MTKPLLPDRVESGLEPCCSDERWAPVPGFEDKYEVSSCGRVWSIPRFHIAKNGVQKRCGGKLLRVRRGSAWQFLPGMGTPPVNVGRQVLELFSGEAAEGREAFTEAEEPGPHLFNLKWHTRSDTVQAAVTRGTRVIGDNHPWSKLSEAQVEKIKTMLRNHIEVSEISNIFGVSSGYIRRIKTGNRRRYASPPNSGQSITPCP